MTNNIIILDSKGCSQNDRHYPMGSGCSNWLPWGELESLYAEFEQKENEKNSKESKCLIEKNEFEQRIRKREVDIPRSTNDDEQFLNKFVSSDQIFLSNPFQNDFNSDNCDLMSDDIDESGVFPEELEDSLLKQLRESIDIIIPNLDSIIDQIQSINPSDYTPENIICIKGVDSFMRLVKTTDELFQVVNEANNLSYEAEELVSEYNRGIMKFKNAYSKEVNKHYNNGRYNIAFSLAKLLVKSGIDGSEKLYKKCIGKYIESIVAVVERLIDENNYEDALLYLKHMPSCKKKTVLASECKSAMNK